MPIAHNNNTTTMKKKKKTFKKHQRCLQKKQKDATYQTISGEP